MANFARIVEFGMHCVRCKGIHACCIVKYHRTFEPGTHTTTYPLGDRSTCLGLKRPWREVFHLRLFADVKNEWHYTCSLNVCRLGEDRGCGLEDSSLLVISWLRFWSELLLFCRRLKCEGSKSAGSTWALTGGVLCRFTESRRATAESFEVFFLFLFCFLLSVPLFQSLIVHWKSNCIRCW